MSRQRSVKRIFSFSSGTLNKLGIWGAVIGSARDRSARLLDLGARGGGHCHALHAELAPHVTHAEQLDRVIRPAHQPRPEQRVGRHLHTLGELIQVADVHDLGRLLERVGEATFGDAPDERHLAALEPGPRLAARARPDRSEEHTSELQSHGLISYAVFCLKKKKKKKNKKKIITLKKKKIKKTKKKIK